MLIYLKLARDNKRIQVKSVAFSVGELRAYAEPTKRKASTAPKMTKSRRVEVRGPVL